jgi:ABC-type transport system involved in multi-copper enzyme maturation permease subunit
MPVLTLARLALFETVRRRLLLAVGILTVLLMGLSGWGFSALTKQHWALHTEFLATISLLVIAIAYMFSIILAVGAAFMAAPALASDIESGVVLSILPRPIRRSDLVLGKWLGLALLLVSFTVVASYLEMSIVKLVTDYWPPHPDKAVLFMSGEGLVLMTLALLLSTRLSPMTGGIVAVVLFGITWIAGIASTIGQAINNTTLIHAGTVVNLILPTDGLWRGAAYYLEPAALLALTQTGEARGISGPFSASAPPPTSFLIWAVGWVIVVLGTAVLRFNQRDL